MQCSTCTTPEAKRQRGRTEGDQGRVDLAGGLAQLRARGRELRDLGSRIFSTGKSGRGRTESDQGRVGLARGLAQLRARGCNLRDLRALHLVELRTRRAHSTVRRVAYWTLAADQLASVLSSLQKRPCAFTMASYADVPA